MLAFRTEVPKAHSAEDRAAGPYRLRTPDVKSLRKTKQHDPEHEEIAACWEVVTPSVAHKLAKELKEQG
jgi:hypothetical protein